MQRRINKFFILLFFSLFSCGKKEIKEEIYYPVKIQKVIKKDVPLYLNTIGHVDPINTVQVQSQIEGILQKVHFKQGSYVKKNDLLFTIDPRPYQIALKKAEAELEENMANLYIASEKLERNFPLLKDGYISKLDLEEMRTNVMRIKALIEQNEASIEAEKLNISYCHISSPIDGKTGILQITKGNLIEKNGKPLISIHQISPIFVTFSIPEEDFSKIKIQDDVLIDTISGKLKIIDNKIDQDLGKIQLKAIFSNIEKNLWPGQFVKIKLITDIKKNALLIPKEAVLLTDFGKAVFVLQGERAILKKILTSQEENGLIIAEGISKEDFVITEGAINLSNNSKVQVKE